MAKEGNESSLALFLSSLKLHSVDWDVETLCHSGSVLWVAFVEDLDLSLLDLKVGSLDGSDEI